MPAQFLPPRPSRKRGMWSAVVTVAAGGQGPQHRYFEDFFTPNENNQQWEKMLSGPEILVSLCQTIELRENL